MSNARYAVLRVVSRLAVDTRFTRNDNVNAACFIFTLTHTHYQLSPTETLLFCIWLIQFGVRICFRLVFPFIATLSSQIHIHVHTIRTCNRVRTNIYIWSVVYLPKSAITPAISTMNITPDQSALPNAYGNGKISFWNDINNIIETRQHVVPGGIAFIRHH